MDVMNSDVSTCVSVNLTCKHCPIYLDHCAECVVICESVHFLLRENSSADLPFMWLVSERERVRCSRKCEGSMTLTWVYGGTTWWWQPASNSPSQ